MILFNSIQEHKRVKCTRIGDIISSFGHIRRADTDVPTRTSVETPKVAGAQQGSSAGVSERKFDQASVDAKVESFMGQGHTSGARSPQQAPDAHAPDTPEMAEYKAKHQKEWQARKDAEARDKLFGQSTPGRVDGEEVQPFSSQRLESESASLTSAAKAKAEKAAPARNISLLRTAVIAAPFSAAGLIVAGAVNAYTKTLIDPAPVSNALTQEDLTNALIVDQTRHDVFKAANTWNGLNGYKDFAPGLSYASKDDDGRMDDLEELVDIAEAQLAINAKEMGISLTFASTGAPKDDIEGRAWDINTRLAVLTVLFKRMSAKLKAGVA